MASKWVWWTLGGIGLIALLSQGNKYRVVQNLSEVKLGENFSLDEFVRTSTGLDNVPNDEQIENLLALVINVLQPLRTYLGRPITIRSGFRSDAVNESQPGSAKNSQHKEGKASDIVVAGLTNQQIIDAIRKLRLPYDQLIDERKNSDWVHVSFNKDAAPRYQWLTGRFNSATGDYDYVTIQKGLIA